MKKLLLILLLCSIFGCSNTSKSKTPDLSQTNLKRLFEEGWEFYIFEGKLVLQKETEKGVLIKDFFKTLGKDYEDF